MTVPDGIIDLEDGRLLTPEGEAVFAYSGYEGCPWLVETRGRRQTRDTACKTLQRGKAC